MTLPSTGTIPAAAAEQALVDLAAAHDVALDPRVASALASLVSTAAVEDRSADPDDCRWVVTETNSDTGSSYCEGRDTLAEALLMLTGGLLNDATVDTSTLAGPHPGRT